MPDSTEIALKPLPETDATTRLLVEAISFIKQWAFSDSHPEIIPTPRQKEELRTDREDWLHSADRWAKNKPAAASSRAQATADAPDAPRLNLHDPKCCA